jgi:2-dehydropantoate 2-reductase
LQRQGAAADSLAIGETNASIYKKDKRVNQIESVVIVGAGAMGAAYAAMFSDAGGFNVSFAASGKRYEKLSQGSLSVNGSTYTVPVVLPEEAPATDLVIVALKHHHLAGAMDDIAALVGENTIVLSVMNGLESEDAIGAVCGMDKLVYAIAVGIDAVREGDRFTYANPGRILFGGTDLTGGGVKLSRLKDALDRAGVPCEIPDDIESVLWWKWMINVGINQASAVLGATYSLFQSSADARALMTSLMEEVLSLAEAAGVDLSRDSLDEWLGILSSLSPGGKTSMLQDVEARRKTEVEIFAGKAIALGEHLNVPTPVNETVFRIIRVLENNYL